jgi:hypothetical protein
MKMKKVAATMLVFIAVGCFNLERVRAEAPKPKGGCWSRNIAMRSIEDLQPKTAVKGRVIAIEYNNRDRQPLAKKEIVVWVRVKTANGSIQSIYLGSHQDLVRQNLRIKVGDIIKVQGVQTIKPKQLPTIVASTIEQGDRVWKINNVTAKPIEAQWCQHNG